MAEFLLFRYLYLYISLPCLLKESSTDFKNDVVVTGFKKIAVLLLTCMTV